MSSGRLVTGSGVSFRLTGVRFTDGAIILKGSTKADHDYHEAEPWQGVTLYGDDDTIIGLFPENTGEVPAHTPKGVIMDYQFRITLDHL